MILRIARLPVAAENKEVFLNYFNASKKQIRNFDGCMHLELFEDASVKHHFFTISHWQSESHLQSYLQSELFRSTWKKVRPLFEESPAAWSLKKLQGVASGAS